MSETTATRAPMRCGYCTDRAVAWIEWKTIGRPKGAPVCATHLAARNVPDNFGDLLKVIEMLDGSVPPPHGDQPHPHVSRVTITRSAS